MCMIILYYICTALFTYFMSMSMSIKKSHKLKDSKTNLNLIVVSVFFLVCDGYSYFILDLLIKK